MRVRACLPSPLKSKGSHRATIWICSRVCQHLLLFWGPDPIKDIVRHSFAFFLSAWNELHALEGGSKISVLKQETCWMLKTMYSQLRLQKVQRPLLKGFSLNTYTRFHPLVCRFQLWRRVPQGRKSCNPICQTGQGCTREKAGWRHQPCCTVQELGNRWAITKTKLLWAMRGKGAVPSDLCSTSHSFLLL